MLVEGIDFPEHAAPLVEKLVTKARELGGRKCVYLVDIPELRAGLIPASEKRVGVGVFLRIVPRAYGAQVLLNKVSKYKRPSRRLTPENVDDILADLPLWYEEVKELIHIREGKTKNPKWTTDELILALDQYFKTPPWTINKDHPAVVALSEELNRLSAYTDAPDQARYRNPNGVYMKLMNLQYLDPTRDGRGLKGGGNDEVDIWETYASDRPRLVSVANAIRLGIKISHDNSADQEDEDIEFAEGRTLTVLHNRRERNPQLRKELVSRRRKAGLLHCDLCTWRPPLVPGYDDAGLEGHHILPLAMAAQHKATKLSDMSLLCANCHRLAHRAIALQKRWLTLDELRRLLQNASTA